MKQELDGTHVMMQQEHDANPWLREVGRSEAAVVVIERQVTQGILCNDT